MSWRTVPIRMRSTWLGMTRRRMSNISTFYRHIKDEEEMEQLGASFASQLPQRNGNIIFLIGDLGCGKTCFTRGLARAWCKNDTLEVTSPTYLLMNTYDPPYNEKRNTLYHLDLYRLDQVNETDSQALGLMDAFSNGLTIIEWPDRLQDIPTDRLEVHIKYTDDHDIRQVHIETFGDLWRPFNKWFSN